MQVPDEVSQDEGLSTCSRDLNQPTSHSFEDQALDCILLVVTVQVRVFPVPDQLIVPP